MSDSTNNFNDIDFLPSEYREQTIKRRTHLWRLLVVVVFGSMFALIALYQRELYRGAAEVLAQVDSQHLAAMAQTRQLSDLHAKLLPATASAELQTFLRHPWPRTQVLLAITQPLPASVRLTKLQLLKEAVAKPTASPSTPEPKVASVGGRAAATDLEKMRAEAQDAQWVVLLEGTTSEVAAFHEYLAAVGRHRLFTGVELGSLGSSMDSAQGGIQFRIRVKLRPGYGLPGGPEASSVAQAKAVSGLQQVATP